MKVTNLTVEATSFSSKREVIINFSSRFMAGMNVIYGPPGSGKTTLLQTLAGLRKPASGKVVCESKLSLVSQVPEREFIYSSCAGELGVTGTEKEVKEDLKKIGLNSSLMEISPWNLSRGEKKRLAILRALREHSGKRKVLIVDDPFCDLDRAGREKIAGLLKVSGDVVVIIATNRREDLQLLEKKGIEYKIFHL